MKDSIPPRPSPHSLGILGALFVQSLEITNPDECRQWGLVAQAFIGAFENHRDPLLSSLLQLNDMTYRRWFKPTWKDAP